MANLAIDTFPTERLGLVTGSVCSVLFPKRSAEVGQDKLARKLAKEKFFQFYDEVSTWQMEHGTMSEVMALEQFQKYHDAEAVKGEWISDADIGGSPDAVSHEYGIDFKCATSLEKWLSYLYDGVDDQQFNQAQMYMRLKGFKKWVIAAFLVETQWMSDQGLTYPVAHDKRIIIVEVPKLDGWNEKLAIEVPKIIAKRDEYIEILKLKFNETKN